MIMFLKYMDSKDNINCNICKSHTVKSYCEFCQVNLCKFCIGEHIGDVYDRHKIVPFHERKTTLIYPECETHCNKTCELKCQQCNKYICTFCLASEDHKDHAFIVLEDIYKSMKQDIKKDTEDLQKVLFPKYEELRSELEKEISNLSEGYKRLTTEISKQGEKWHRKIDSIVNKMHNDLSEIEVNHRHALQQHLVEIQQIESLIKDTLTALMKLEDSNNVTTVLEYTPENNKYTSLPDKFQCWLPSFYPKPINSNLVHNMFGTVCNWKLSDSPEVINTFSSRHNLLRCVFVHNEQEIWTSGEYYEIRSFNRVAKPTTTIQTLSGEWPSDITVTNNGELIYCDWKLCTVNKIVNNETEVFIRLHGWTPTNLFATAYGDLLVVMRSNDNSQSKVVRYSNDKECQKIQYNEEGMPLYSGNTKIKFINENRNLDICVADSRTNSVVVVDQLGKLRFRYTGHPSEARRNPFKPFGITTNSQGQILTADHNNHCIHILDKDGQFLLYIDDVIDPFGLCIDRYDMLFVTEYTTGNVKVIKYFE